MSEATRCKFRNVNVDWNLSIPARLTFYYTDSERFHFLQLNFLPSFLRAVVRLLTRLWWALSDQAAGTFFRDADRLVWERWKLFSCSGQKESSNPITSYLTGDKMDGIRDPPPPGNSSSYFCCFFRTSFLFFFFLFSLSSSIFIGLEPRILIWRGVLSWGGVIFLCYKGWKEGYVGNWNFACHTIL